MNKKIFIPIIILCAFGLIMLGKKIAPNQEIQPTQDNVSIVDSKQIITITAKGGYTPSATIAQANTETTLRIKTNSTFDCSSAFIIPSLGYRKNLSPTSVTDIPIPPQPKGAVLQGMCSMGMYRMTIAFE